MLLEINFGLHYNLFVLCYKDHIFSISILIWSFWPNIWTWTPPANNYHTCQVYLQKFACLSKKSLIPIWRQILHHKNTSTGSLSVFSKSKKGKSELLNKLERPKGDKSDLNKIEGNIICGVWCVLLYVGSVASKLTPSKFQQWLDGSIDLLSSWLVLHIF